MPTLQIIGGPASNFVWVTRIVCAEKGVAYELLPVLPHTPEIDAIHPLGKIPGMRHGAVTLGESRAICRYIDQVFPGPSLVPADAAAGALTEQWVSIICTAIDPIMLRTYIAAYLFPGTADGSPDRARIETALPKMASQFALLDRALAKTGHLVGESFTLADTYLTPILFYMSRNPESSAMLGQCAHLPAYIDRHLGRKSVREAMPQVLPNGRRL